MTMRATQTRNLALKNLRFDADELRLELCIARTNLGKVIFDLEQRRHVKSRVVIGAGKHLYQRFGRVVALPQAERRNAGVDDVGAGFNRLHQADKRDAGGSMHVHMDAGCFATGLLDATDHIVCRLRAEQRCHIFDADRIAAEVAQLFGHLDKRADRVQWRCRVTDRPLGVLARTLNRRQCAAQIADVVESVKNAKDVHAILGRLFYKSIDDRIFVVPIPEQVLSSQQHL